MRASDVTELLEAGALTSGASTPIMRPTQNCHVRRPWTFRTPSPSPLARRPSRPLGSHRTRLIERRADQVEQIDAIAARFLRSRFEELTLLVREFPGGGRRGNGEGEGEGEEEEGRTWYLIFKLIASDVLDFCIYFLLQCYLKMKQTNKRKKVHKDSPQKEGGGGGNGEVVVIESE